MKKLIVPLGILLAGGGVGGGAAFATRQFVGAKTATAATTADAEPLVFVPVTKVIAPLVLADGALAGYVVFDTELQVADTAAPDVTAKLPLLLHAINMRTYRAPLGTGPDGMLANIDELKHVVRAACDETFGKATVRRIAITHAEPI